MRTSSSSCRYSFNVKLHKPKLLDLKFQEKATEICIKESLYTFQPVLYLYLLVKLAKLHITTTIVGCNRFRSLQFFSKHLVLLLISESTFLFNFFFFTELVCTLPLHHKLHKLLNTFVSYHFQL